MSRPITVSIAQLRDILAGINHSTMFSATTLTDAKARKTNNPIGVVRKLTRINGVTGASYGTSVERQQFREGIEQPSFQAQQRSWGQRISAALVEDKGSFYLPAQLNPALKPKPLYLIERRVSPNGAPKLVAVDKSVVAPFLPPSRGGEKAAAQGVEREVVYRDYRLDSIVNLSILGRKYRVRQTS